VETEILGIIGNMGEFVRVAALALALFFPSLPAQDRRMKLRNIFEKDTKPVSYTAGTVIFKEGQERDCMYVVKTGEVDLLVRGQLAETVSPEGFFGELALIDRAPRTATAVAKTDCSLIPITEKQFLFLVHEVPFFALTIMRSMGARIRSRVAQFGVMPWAGSENKN
jgi:CRP/FNR family transcriptional regulator, cyclic AMP receptor protein